MLSRLVTCSPTTSPAKISLLRELKAGPEAYKKEGAVFLQRLLTRPQPRSKATSA